MTETSVCKKPSGGRISPASTISTVTRRLAACSPEGAARLRRFARRSSLFLPSRSSDARLLTDLVCEFTSAERGRLWPEVGNVVLSSTENDAHSWREVQYYLSASEGTSCSSFRRKRLADQTHRTTSPGNQLARGNRYTKREAESFDNYDCKLWP